MSFNKSIERLLLTQVVGGRERGWRKGVAGWEKDYVGHMRGFHPTVDISVRKTGPILYVDDCGICTRLARVQIRNVAEGVELARFKKRHNLD